MEYWFLNPLAFEVWGPIVSHIIIALYIAAMLWRIRFLIVTRTNGMVLV